MKEWLTATELSDETGLDRKYIASLARKNIFPEDAIKWEGKHRIYHCSIIPLLLERGKRLKICQTIENPPDVIPYDGFYLTRDAIERLEYVRRQNGYRTTHWTTKTLDELIQMGGDSIQYPDESV